MIQAGCSGAAEGRSTVRDLLYAPIQAISSPARRPDTRARMMLRSKRHLDKAIRDFCEGEPYPPPLYPVREAITKTIAIILVIGLTLWIIRACVH